MNNIINPLDNIKIACSCPAKWDEMYGDDRKRFCSECKLNVYNLAGLTRSDAENLLLNSEGRMCMRIHRRKDGKVLTRNCPVGWRSTKLRATKLFAATVAMITTMFGGLLSFKIFSSDTETVYGESVEVIEESTEVISFGGIVSNLPEIKIEILRNRGE